MLLYRLLTIIFSPIILGHIIWLSIKNKQTRYFWQRLGFNYSQLPKNCLWFHCASVGEVNTLMPLLINIHNKNEKLKFIITTNTITGGEIVKKKKLGYLYHCYLPFDWNHSINRFLTTTKPSVIYIMETEIWPNLFALCANKIDVYLINARLSSKTTSSPQWIKSLLKNSLSNAKFIYTRSEKDTQAYKNLGANNQHIATTGNLKLTAVLDNLQSTNTSTKITEREYVLLASTHNNEEREIYNIWKKLNRKELLIIAPRHPERGQSIQKQLNNINIATRSQNTTITQQTEIYLLDTVGELKNYFSTAKAVIMGGSFVPIGGHNILEPASFHCAIITGIYMENFQEELNLMLETKSIIQVKDYNELSDKLEELLDSKELRTSLTNKTSDLENKASLVLEKYTDIIHTTNYTK
ncbi:3-deoxy-D-manno-octulosonic acid transferase [hydrothermal vent metagenome]|uniref:3-deoxy-D-manno-octulosonic acid transferase n=1 Tax=hydrothermal vent metagenome TaxID=652676 RepID=A0A3B0W5C6_9ZZZZ